MSVKMTPNGTRGQARPPGPLMGILSRFMRASYRFGSKRMDGQPVVLLTTRGARSGQLRTNPVMSFPEGDSAWLVVASFGGAAQHPAWFGNLARHPEDAWIEVDGRRLKVTPTSLSGEERERAWATITAKSPRFVGYQQKTDREIPVVRLTAD
ncbi:MAG TPA: nitroreductase/quinone reductase family protein [Terriglobales bacterium]|nr:nitroreductase/quinone reductase family protein [Terriglobales bacterium]